MTQPVPPSHDAAPSHDAGPSHYAGPSHDAGPERGPAPRPPSSATALFLSTTLILEAFVVLFAALVLHGLGDLPRGWIWAVAAVAIVLCVVAAAMVRRRPRVGVTLGWVVQAGLVLLIALVPLMAVLALAFGLVWILSLREGPRIDRERKERYAAELEHWSGGQQIGSAS